MKVPFTPSRTSAEIPGRMLPTRERPLDLRIAKMADPGKFRNPRHPPRAQGTLRNGPKADRHLRPLAGRRALKSAALGPELPASPAERSAASFRSARVAIWDQGAADCPDLQKLRRPALPEMPCIGWCAGSRAWRKAYLRAVSFRVSQPCVQPRTGRKPGLRQEIRANRPWSVNVKALLLNFGRDEQTKP